MTFTSARPSARKSRSAPSRTSTPTTAPLSVNHQGQFPSVTVSFNLAPGVALSDAAQAISQMQQKMGMPVHDPRNVLRNAAGLSSVALPPNRILIITALMAVYIVLGILYESYIHPITILSTLPSAGVGAVLALLIFHMDLSVIALIGIILLIGIVKKNAIMMIDFALAAERKRGQDFRGRDLSGLPAAFPPDPDDHHGRDVAAPCRSPSARAPARNCAGRWASPSSAA